uniref:Uncharacterized protein n=1 Tax=Vespula pensylvanica TaxID=30213 RepID=A0A834NX17_VESPE|nr:hypothetical protein H0235_010338 [Vespula pensylvanica]
MYTIFDDSLGPLPPNVKAFIRFCKEGQSLGQELGDNVVEFSFKIFVGISNIFLSLSAVYENWTEWKGFDLDTYLIPRLFTYNKVLKV